MGAVPVGDCTHFFPFLGLTLNAKQQLEQVQKGISELISPEYLLKKIQQSLDTKKPLKVKAGFDPSSPDIHLGHTVLLNKLRQFQDLGHEVIYIIGDGTAKVGDPSGRSQMRPMLSEKEIKSNAKTYQKQAFRILNPKQTQTVYNSKWFSKMSFEDMMQLAAKVTISQILQRDDFEKRLSQGNPVSLLEIFYPLMQAYDSVMIESDIELGGTDQKFNLLLGRELQKSFNQEQQAVMTLPLLVGLDGVQKMSKSLNNHIAIEDSAKDMFGKVMSVSDELMMNYYDLLTDMESRKIKDDIANEKLHPKKAKEELGLLICKKFHSERDSLKAADEFNAVFSNRENPFDMPNATLPAGEMTLIKLMSKLDFVKTGGEARRLIKQGAVSINGKVINDQNSTVFVDRSSKLIKVGKRRFSKFSSE